MSCAVKSILGDLSRSLMITAIMLVHTIFLNDYGCKVLLTDSFP